MKRMGWGVLFLGVMCLFPSHSLRAADGDAEPATIDGTYKGAMTLTDEGTPHDMPFAVVMTLTDEVEEVKVGGATIVQKVIDGNFLIDKEGGPFAFTKVTYRPNTSEIDMKYTRTKGVTVGQPASYRLVGKVQKDGMISGRVLSGFKGTIGTFKLAKTELKALVGKQEYVGVWTGTVKLLPEGDVERFGITIAPTGFAYQNPDQFEFDYSMGKLAHAELGIIRMVLSNVAIDYLHRRIFMSDKGRGNYFSDTVTTVEASLDPATGRLKGTFSTVLGGQKGIFDLSKLTIEE